MVTYIEKPAELLLQDANKYLLQKNYSLAAQTFEEIDKQHPYSNVATIVLRSNYDTVYNDFLLSGDFSTASHCEEGYNIDDLNVDTNDMFFNNDKFFT